MKEDIIKILDFALQIDWFEGTPFIKDKHLAATQIENYIKSKLDGEDVDRTISIILKSLRREYDHPNFIENQTEYLKQEITDIIIP